MRTKLFIWHVKSVSGCHDEQIIVTNLKTKICSYINKILETNNRHLFTHNKNNGSN